MSSSHDLSVSVSPNLTSLSLFNSVYVRLNSAFTSKNNFWSTLAFIWSVLQLCAFVLRFPLPSIFDLNPLFDLVSLRFLSIETYGVKIIFSIYTTFVLSCFLSVLILFFFASSSCSTTASFPVKFVRFYISLFSSVLFLPTISFFFSYFRCFGSSYVPGFQSNLAPYCSNSSLSTLLWTCSVALIAISFILASINILIYEDNPCSRKYFARSHSRTHFKFLISQLIFIGIFYIFPSRFILFRIVYFLTSLYCFILFIKYIPFFRIKTNYFVVFSMGIWLGTSLGLISHAILDYLYSIFNYSTENFALINGIVFYTPMILLSLTGFFIVRIRASKLITTMEILHEYLVEINLIDEDNKLSSDFQHSLLDFNHLNLNTPKSLYDIDVLTRVTGPKPINSKYLPVVKALFNYGEVLFPESPLFLCMKLNYEICVLRDPVVASITTQSIKSLDVDFLVDEELIFYKLTTFLTNLRRTLSTGQAVDTSSFIHLQKRQKELSSLHSDALEYLYAFWSTLSNEHVDLSVLPSILHKVQQTKNRLETDFQRLLHSQSHNQQILQAYAAYCREIVGDFELAQQIEEQANLLSSSEHSRSHDGSSISGSITLTPTKRSKRRSKFSQVSLFASNSNKTQRKSAIKTLKYSVTSALAVMLILSVASFLLVSNVLKTSHNQLEHLYETNHAEYLLQYIGKAANLLYLFGRDASLSGFIDRVTNRLLIESTHLSFHARRLVITAQKLTDSDTCPRAGSRVISEPNSELTDLLLENRFSAFTLVDVIPVEERVDVMNVFSFCLRAALRGAGFANQMMTSSSISSVDLSSINFDLTFAPSMFKTIYDFIIEKAQDYYFFSLFLQVLCGVVILSIIVIIGFGLFARSFSKIKEERNGILNLFLYIPKSEISQILEQQKFEIFRSKNKKSKLTHMEQDNFYEEDVHSSSDSSLQKLDANPEQETFDLVLNVPDTKPTPKNSSEVNAISPIPIKIRLVIGCSVILLLFLFIFSFINSYQASNELEDTRNSLDVALIARSAAADITVIDREISSLVQLFTGFGDTVFLQRYYDHLASGQRTRLLQQLMNLRLSVSELSNIGRSARIIREMRYLENIAISLASSVFPVHSDILPQNFTFDYDTNTETDFYRKFIASYTAPVTHWYTNTQQDLLLSPNERLVLAQHTICSPRWQSLFVDLMNSIEETAKSVAETNVLNVRSELEVVRTELYETLYAVFGVVVVCCGSFGLIFIYKKNLRFGRIVVLVLMVVCGIVLVFSLGISFYALSLINQIDNQSNSAVNVVDTIVDAEFFFLSAKRRAQLFAYEWDLTHVPVALSAVVRANEILDLISSKSLCREAPYFSSICDAIAQAGVQLHAATQLIRSISGISIVLKYTAMTGSLELPLELQHIVWDMDQIPDESRRMFALPNGLSITNLPNDLAKSVQERHELSMALVSTRFYEETTKSIVESYSRMRSVALGVLRNVFETNFKHLEDLFSYLNYSTISFLLVFSVIVGIIIVAGAPEKVEFTHIKQRIRIESVDRFTVQYVSALSGMFFVLLSFFVFSIISFSWSVNYPQVLSHAGHRTALVAELISDVVQYSNNPETSALSISRISSNVDALNGVHNELMLDHLTSNEEQASLLFDAQFSDSSRSHFNISSNFGLHALINHFVFTTRTFVADHRAGRFNFSTVEELVFLAETLEYLSLNSLDVFFNYFDSTTIFFQRVVLIIFITFLVLLFLSYIVVFRRMLVHLELEEVTTVEFLDMLSDSAAMSVDVIRNFLVNRSE
ncbi:hypothetical protein RCL1_004731 [Eukaryota sp. TZLM3-RCL]